MIMTMTQIMNQVNIHSLDLSFISVSIAILVE